MGSRSQRSGFYFKGYWTEPPGYPGLYFKKSKVYQGDRDDSLYSVIRKDIQELKVALGHKDLTDQEFLNPPDGVQTTRFAIRAVKSRQILLVRQPGMKDKTLVEALKQTPVRIRISQGSADIADSQMFSTPVIATTRITPPTAYVSSGSRHHDASPSVGPSVGSQTLLHSKTASNVSQGPTRQTSPSARPAVGNQTLSHPKDASSQSTYRQITGQDITTGGPQGAGRRSSKDASKPFFQLVEGKGRPSLDDPLCILQGANTKPVCLAFTRNGKTTCTDDQVRREHVKLCKELWKKRNLTDSRYLEEDIALQPNEDNKQFLRMEAPANSDIFKSEIPVQRFQCANLIKDLKARFTAAMEEARKNSTNYDLAGKDTDVPAREIRVRDGRDRRDRRGRRRRR